MRYDDRVDNAVKSDFAVRALLETEAIQMALNLHTCNVESTTSEWCLFFTFVSPTNTRIGGRHSVSHGREQLFE